jgi:DNA primase
VLDGGKPMSLFDGYRSVTLLLDADEPGRKAAATIKEIIRQQAPGTPVRDVVFSDVKDVCEFFDQGHSIEDLIKAIRDSPPAGLA